MAAPKNPTSQLIERAVALQADGSGDEAASLYRKVLKTEPKNAVALYSLAAIGLNKGRLSQALEFAERCSVAAPHAALSWYIKGVALKSAARRREALESFERGLGIDPLHIDTLMALGVLQAEMQDPARALAQFEKILAIHPAHEGAARGKAALAEGRGAAAVPSSSGGVPLELVHSGLELQAAGQIADAQAVFHQILGVNPMHFIALYSLAAMEVNQGKVQEGLGHAQRCIDSEPGSAFAWYICGCALKANRRFEEAVRHLDRALEIHPEYKEALFEKGLVYGEVKDYFQSLDQFEKVLAIDPVHRLALVNRATSLTIIQRYEDGAKAFEDLLAVDPEHDYALSQLSHARLHCCDWTGFHKNRQAIIERVRAGKRAAKSLSFLSISDSPEDQLTCARVFSEQSYPQRADPLWKGENYGHAKLRIGYVSPDLREHPVGHVMVGVFEEHNRDKYELHAFSMGVNDNSSLRSRFMAASHHFHDVRGRSSREIAELIRQCEIDVLIDLAGPTMDAQPDIFASRPAPIQVGYLGYPGTSGASYFDFILADEHVIPEESRKFYSEEVIPLPGSYMPTDSKLSPAAETPTRAEMQLPEEGFVFCSFNHDYKINPDVFDVWMRLLKQVEGSVLWLMKLNEAAERNLRKEAEARGVSASRLIFAKRVPSVAAHLARYRLAGLFLDTHPYNAHSTATDVLRVGLPVVTMAGASFQSRVATSILRTIGMPQLSVTTLAEYERLALELALFPEKLAAVRRELQEKIPTAPIFDSARTARGIEAAFELMVAKHRAGGAKPETVPAPKTFPAALPAPPASAHSAEPPSPVQLAVIATGFPLGGPAMTLRYCSLTQASVPFVVVGMFTASHEPTAQRLLASLKEWSLPHLLFEVPVVHCSTSPKGVPDPAYTKANFIAHVMGLVRCPVLYVDVDVVFHGRPVLIEELAAQGRDFAILNWLALDRNDAYLPVPVQGASAESEFGRRFFRYSHQVAFSSREQLLCSGAVQFWGRSPSAFALLRQWHEAVVGNPGAQDDHCLDFAHNNLSLPNLPPLKADWLPKSYARYAWWLFDEPVIDHPDFPYAGGGWAQVQDSLGRPRIHQERVAARVEQAEIAAGQMLDAMTGRVYRLEGGSMKEEGGVMRRTWV